MLYVSHNILTLYIRHNTRTFSQLHRINRRASIVGVWPLFIYLPNIWLRGNILVIIPLFFYELDHIWLRWYPSLNGHFLIVYLINYLNWLFARLIRLLLFYSGRHQIILRCQIPKDFPYKEIRLTRKELKKGIGIGENRLIRCRNTFLRRKMIFWS